MTVQEVGVGSWESVSVNLAPGDALLMFTDGVDETRSPDGKLLGKNAVERVFAQVEGEPAEFSELMRKTMRDFAAGTRQRDDTTFLVVKRG